MPLTWKLTAKLNTALFIFQRYFKKSPKTFLMISLTFNYFINNGNS